MKYWIHFFHFCLVALLPVWATAATPAGSSSATSTAEYAPPPNVCKTEVAKFEETLGFIRQHQGVEAAAAIKEKLLPAKLEAELLATQGYCGLARYIHEKKLNR